MANPIYLHLKPGEPPPALEGAELFKVVVIVEADVTAEWQGQVSDWLVANGCRYMMAWGRDCSSWDDSVDWASLEATNYEVSDDTLIMTTWHDEESMDDTFSFAKRDAMDPQFAQERAYILHIAPGERRDEMLRRYRDAEV